MWDIFKLKKAGIFAGGVLFGTAGVKILASDDAKKVYTNCTAAVLRAKDCVMKTATTVQENAEDILAEAQQINESRAAKEAEAVYEAEEAEETEIQISMKFIVKHEINGRLRIHVVQKRMTYTEADTLSWFLSNQKNVTDVKVYERTADAVICYVGDKEEVLNLLKQFSYENAISGKAGHEDSSSLWKQVIPSNAGPCSDYICKISEIYLARNPLPDAW